MSDVKKQDKRKNKKKYFQSKRQKSGGRSLEAGLKGFLITCNNEPQCVKESYNLLNEFAETLYGPENKDANDSQGSDSEDLEEQLAKEIQEIKDEKKRFQQMSTKVKGIIFIGTTVDDPTSLVTSIFENVLQTKKRKSRHILKLQPIITTCKATEEDIKKAMDTNLSNFVKMDGNEALSYKIEPKVRHNSNITSSHILWYTRQSFEKYAPEWKVSMLNPDVVVSITILKSVCCIGFLKNYMGYKKYNLSEVASINEKAISEPPSCSQDNENSDTNKTDSVNNP